MKTISYQVVLEWDEEGKAWNVTVPALPGAIPLEAPDLKPWNVLKKPLPDIWKLCAMLASECRRGMVKPQLRLSRSQSRSESPAKGYRTQVARALERAGFVLVRVSG